MPRLNGQSPQEPPWSRRSLISTVGDWDESSTPSGTIGKLASHRQKNVDATQFVQRVGTEGMEGGRSTRRRSDGGSFGDSRLTAAGLPGDRAERIESKPEA